MIDSTKKYLANMSQLIFTLPVQLGRDKVPLGIVECFDGYETYYKATIPALGKDKAHTLRIEPYGDVYFLFDKDAPKELLRYEGIISKAIFNYHYFEGLI